MDQTNRAGFARVDITPDYPVPLGGYGNSSQRFSQKVLEPLTASCVAFSDGDGNTVLLFTLDLIRSTAKLTKTAKKLISEETGVPEQNMLFCATHTHAAPEISSDEESVLAFLKELYPKLLSCAKEALADLTEAEISFGAAETENLTFVRRYLCADGSLYVKNISEGAPVTHESEADRTAQFLRLSRKDKKDILMVNFQAHSTITGGLLKYDLSSDYASPLRKAIEEEGFLCAYFQGACGNLNPSGALPEEKEKKLGHTAYGQTLASYVLGALGGAKKASSGPVKTLSRTLTAASNHTRDHEAGHAKEIIELHDSEGREAIKPLLAKYGIQSIYSARSILRKTKLGDSGQLPLNAVTVGGIAFAAVPNELFDTIGMDVKERSPYQMTFICELTNDGLTYLPTKKAFANGGYETDKCLFVEGTAEAVGDELVDMLHTMYNGT